MAKEKIEMLGSVFGTIIYPKWWCVNLKAFLDAIQDESHRNGVCSLGVCIEMDACVICLYFRSNYRGIQFCLDMHAIGHNLMSALRKKTRVCG